MGRDTTIPTALIWLSEAAECVAGRLMEVDSETFHSHETALEEARKRLEELAYRGAIEIYGKWFEEREIQSFEHEWEVVPTSYWSRRYKLENASPNW